MDTDKKKNTRIVYRIENPEDKDGMWYDKNGMGIRIVRK